MKRLLLAAAVLVTCLAIWATWRVRSILAERNCFYEVQGGFCITGPHYALSRSTPRASSLPAEAALRAGRIEFTVGGAVELRPRVRIDVAAGQLVLQEVESRWEAGAVGTTCWELSCRLAAAEMALLLDELVTPEFLAWAGSSHASYDADVMDGALLELRFATATADWSVICFNHFPEPLRRFGCTLSEQVRRRRFGLESSTEFVRGTYRPPPGVTVTKITR